MPSRCERTWANIASVQMLLPPSIGGTSARQLSSASLFVKAPRPQTSPISYEYLNPGFAQGGNQLRRGLSIGDENYDVVNGDDLRKNRATQLCGISQHDNAPLGAHHLGPHRSLFEYCRRPSAPRYAAAPAH